jgi:hypothetical protein
MYLLKPHGFLYLGRGFGGVGRRRGERGLCGLEAGSGCPGCCALARTLRARPFPSRQPAPAPQRPARARTSRASASASPTTAGAPGWWACTSTARRARRSRSRPTWSATASRRPTRRDPCGTCRCSTSACWSSSCLWGGRGGGGGGGGGFVWVQGRRHRRGGRGARAGALHTSPPPGAGARGASLTGVVAGAGVGDHDDDGGVVVVAHLGALEPLAVAVGKVGAAALDL